MFVRTCGFESRPRHHLYLVRQKYSSIGDVAKWFKAEVCKTSIRRFESARRLHIATELKKALEKSGASSRLTTVTKDSGELSQTTMSGPVITPH